MTRLRVKPHVAYIFEALFEYMVSLLVTGTFLAAILKQVGVSDALTGVLSSIVSITCLFQLLSGLIEKPGRKIRKTLVAFTLANELLFACLYLVPSVPVSSNAKTALFVAMILCAYFLYNIASPAKYRWLMSFVDSGKRGSFSAKKEMVSLIGGMLFSLGMGRLVDHYNAVGKEQTGFALCCVTIFAVTVLHLITLLSVEDETLPPAADHGGRFREILRFLQNNKAIRRLIVLDVLWKSAIYMTTPFMGTYLIGELRFSLTDVSLITMVFSFARMLVSPFTGRYADKNGWCKLLMICVSIAAAGFFVNMFASPGSRWCYIVYGLCYYIAMAGINSSLFNITYDYVDESRFSVAFGAKNAIGGAAGFLVSLVGGLIVSAMQDGGNRLLGGTVYAQQVLSCITFLLLVGMVVYLTVVIRKLPKIEKRR